MALPVLLFVPLGYIGFWQLIEVYRGLKEILLEGGPKGAILSMLIWTAVWIIGLRQFVRLIIYILKLHALLKEGKTDKFLKDLNILGADPSDSDQSFYSKLPETLSLAQRIKIFCNKLRKTFSLRGDNSISGNNSAGARVEDITKSAKKGDARAQFSLGWMYAEGKDTPQDDKQAVHWYTKSAEQGSAWAQYNLGLMYDNGRGVPQDYEKAIDWYTKSAEQGNAAAQFSLGLMYDNGRGVPQDYEKAIDWFTKSAEQGFAWAQNHLGLMYNNGRGVPQDDKQAVHWYTKSAEQGLAAAQNNLGLMYDNGRGVHTRL